MNKIIVIHPDYTNLSQQIQSIPNDFDDTGTLIHTGRNKVRKVTFGNETVIIKSFHRLTVANRYIYVFFRKSKAQRSFENAFFLRCSGIATPDPIAFIDTIKNGKLTNSYYISRYCDYQSLSKIKEMSYVDSEPIYRAFAHFCYQLHSLGIYHNDFKLDNVLFTHTSTGYIFSLIDLNRMTIQAYSTKRSMKNLQKLNIPIESFAIVASEYAKISHQSPVPTLQRMLFFEQTDKCLSSMKQIIKSFIKKPKILTCNLNRIKL